MMNKFYITTSIAYTNAKPHIGYALELVQADTLARYHRSKGQDVFFLTGTDDHGIKIYRSAQEKKISPKEFVDENIKAFRKLTQKLNISNDGFISTSDDAAHMAGAQKLWTKLIESGDIYKKSYEGMYCAGCEAFLTQRDLVDGKCPNHNKEPEILKEENYFFKLTKYKDEIIEKIKTDEIKIIPEARKNEILNILKELEDVSFSRPKEKLPWGIPVPGDESQVMYVWCDALSNYLTGLGYGQKNEANFEKFWPADVHCIGKDILRFHAAIWPAMLMSAKLKLPKQIFVHGWITSEGQKISKSLGNVVDPFEIIEKYGTDALRYYLLREIPATGDGDFSQKRFEEVYNGELIGQMGNALNRVVVMAKRYNVNVPDKEMIVDMIKRHVSESNNRLEWTPESRLKVSLENTYDFSMSLSEVMNKVKTLNGYIELDKPWELAKDGKNEIMDKKFFDYFYYLYRISDNLEFFLPETAKKIKNQLETLEAEPLFLKIK